MTLLILVLHSNTAQHKNSFFVHTPTDWNHLNDNQVEAPTLEDFKRQIITQNTIWFACAHSPPITFIYISKVRSGDISHQDQDAFPVTTDTSSLVLLYVYRHCTDFQWWSPGRPPPFSYSSIALKNYWHCGAYSFMASHWLLTLLQHIVCFLFVCFYICCCWSVALRPQKP